MAQRSGRPAIEVDAAVWGMLGAATVFLSLRLYGRRTRARRTGRTPRFWPDDYMLAAAWAFTLASSAALTALMGMGYMDTTMTAPRVLPLERFAHTGHIVALMLAKNSFAATLLRLTKHRWQRAVLWSIIASVCVLFAAQAVLLWRPICHIVDDHALPVSCWGAENPLAMNVVASFYSAVCDFILAALPWNFVMGIGQMAKSKRVAIALAMSVGVVAGITGLAKASLSLRTIGYIEKRERTLDYNGGEFFHCMSILWIFSLAEPNATIIAASVPVLRPMFRRDARSGGGDQTTATSRLTGMPMLDANKWNLYNNRDSNSETNTLPRRVGAIDGHGLREERRVGGPGEQGCDTATRPAFPTVPRAVARGHGSCESWV